MRLRAIAGRSIRPIAGSVVSGDACDVVRYERGLVIGLADGLGHGERAAAAANAFLATMRAEVARPLEDLFAAAHRALRHTRGAVAAVARIDEENAKIEVAILGNIAVGLIRAGGRATRLVGTPGVLGSAYRHVRPQGLDLEEGDALFMHSDGVHGRFDFEELRGMSPQNGADHAVRSAGRSSDDAAFVFVRFSAAPSAAATTPLDRSATTLAIVRPTDPACAATETRAHAARLGFSPRAQWELSIVVSELATNVLKFAGEGTLTLRFEETPKRALVLEMVDRGRGIPDVDAARIDGYSEGAFLSPDRIRHEGQGLGVGLGSVHRLGDDVRIDSHPERGTRIVVRKYL